MHTFGDDHPGRRRVRRVGPGSAADYTEVSIVEILSQLGKAIKCARKENSAHGMIKMVLASLTLVALVKKSSSIFQHSAIGADGQRLARWPCRSASVAT